MTVATLARKVLPPRARITAGVWVINMASCNWPLLRMYLSILHGRAPQNMGLTEEHCYYDYEGRRIMAPKNAAGVFMEIFQEEVYEQVWRPREGDTIIDIGAYVGMFTVKAASLVGATGKVIAIEPSPENYDLLARNCEDLHNVTLVKKAIMATNGMGRLYYSKSAAANSLVTRWKEYVEVQTITLDDLVEELGLDKVDIIKVDAEGAEIDVLKGARKVLAKGTRLVIAAYHTAPNGKAEIAQVVTALHAADYRATRVRGLRSYIYAEKVKVFSSASKDSPVGR